MGRILKTFLGPLVSKTTTQTESEIQVIDELWKHYKELQSEYKAEETEKDVGRETRLEGKTSSSCMNSAGIPQCKKQAASRSSSGGSCLVHSARWTRGYLYLIARPFYCIWHSVWELPAASSLKSARKPGSVSKIQGVQPMTTPPRITIVGMCRALKCLKTHGSTVKQGTITA
ncbi:hypothetical protein GWK47_043869 [Chionoecetes opilio]|uniref:Uncharacterized protein n=1 Tax=Chionoecetes opilio TaxID=41210 RepID=A0A8J4YKL2_CHIOP|nr:hypothetical protein GWK47_043869 [Chionoecetes opilio]